MLKDKIDWSSSIAMDPSRLDSRDVTLNQEARSRSIVGSESKIVYRPLTLNKFMEERLILPALRLQEGPMKHNSLDEILLMLHSLDWQEEEVKKAHEEDEDGLRKRSGLTSSVNFLDQFQKEQNGFICPICGEKGSMDSFGLACGHRYCALCYHRYVVELVHKGSKIVCIEPNCSLALYHSAVQVLYDQTVAKPSTWLLSRLRKRIRNKFFLDVSCENITESSEPRLGDISNTYQCNRLLRSVARHMVDRENQTLRWYPIADCENLVELHRNQGTNSEDTIENPIMKCSSEHEFCFECKCRSHSPCPCSIAAKVNRFQAPDSQSIFWIETNTMRCPFCAIPIQKNGGCSVMKCRCKRSFHWDLKNVITVSEFAGVQIYSSLHLENHSAVYAIKSCLAQCLDVMIRKGQTAGFIKTNILLETIYGYLAGYINLIFWTKTLLLNTVDRHGIEQVEAVFDNIIEDIRVSANKVAKCLKVLRKSRGQMVKIYHNCESIKKLVSAMESDKLQIIDLAIQMQKGRKMVKI